jgi:uncharacterized protein (TIGR00369 family)
VNDRFRYREDAIMTISTAELIPPPDGGSQEDWRAWAESLPASRVMGLSCELAEEGHVRVVLNDAHWPLNPNGAVHGGMVAAWADHCFGLVASTSLGAGQVPATATLTVEFIRPALPPLAFDARVDRSGRSLAFISVDVLDRANRLCAKVIGTMSIDGTSRFLDGDSRSS